MESEIGGGDGVKMTSSKLIVYFHGNAEDVGSCYDMLVKLSIEFKCSVLAMEYPGYAIYKSESPDA